MELFLNNVRLSFPDLRKRGKPAKDKPNEPGKFGCQGIFDKESPAHIALRAAVIAVAKEKWPEAWGVIVKGLGNDKKCLREGDQNLDGKNKVREEYAGKMYVKASNREAVPLIAAKAKKADGSWNILPPESGKPYGGCYVNLKIDVYAIDSPDFGKGIHASLLAVQFVRDGESFGGAPATADGFDDVEGAVDEEAETSMDGSTGAAVVGSSNEDLGL